MKKIFKGLAILAASTAVCAGIGMAAGCSDATDGTYVGEYHYVNAYGQTYGMVVEVKVEKNIITKITDITNTDSAKALQTYKDADATEDTYHTWTTVSPGWVDYYVMMWGFGEPQGSVEPTYSNGYLTNEEEIEALMPDYYGWTNDNAAVWPTYENWLLQQYEGWSVADVLNIKVFYSSYGEPYKTSGGFNAELSSSGLLITGSTQGSGRLMLAVQNALSK